MRFIVAKSSSSTLIERTSDALQYDLHSEAALSSGCAFDDSSADLRMHWIAHSGLRAFRWDNGFVALILCRVCAVPPRHPPGIPTARDLPLDK